MPSDRGPVGSGESAIVASSPHPPVGTGYLRLTLASAAAESDPRAAYGGEVLDGTDIILIHQLLGRYGRAIDDRRWDAFELLFVPDATIDHRGGTGHVVREGREAIVEWFRDLADTHPPAHH